MAAPDFTLVRGGQINQANDDRALFLKVYGGEVMTSFNERNVYMDRHYVRTIKSGKSAQFPAVGGKSAAYHTPGTMIVGEAANLNEVLITVDGLLIARTAIPNIDEAMTHFDYRTPFSREDGKALSTQFDKTISRLITLAARTDTSRLDSADKYAAKTVGFTKNAATAGTSVSAMKAALVDVQVNFDGKDIPEDERYAAFKPALYWLLASDPETISADYGKAGDIKTAKLPQLLGFNMLKTNNLEQANVTGTYGDKYNVDGRNTLAQCWTPPAVGTLKLRDISVGMTGAEYEVTHQATLMVSKYLMGHGVLRPECAAEIRTADPA